MTSQPSRGTPDRAEVPEDAAAAPLAELDRRILALESRTFRFVGTKERAIREEIGISRTAYYVRLNSLLDQPEALRAAPAVIHRLRRQRVSGQEGDSARGTGRVA